MLDLNVTLLIQLVNFFVALFLLNTLLIRPIRDIIRQRKAVMDGMSSEASRDEAAAGERLANYEAQLAAARQEAGRNREGARAAGNSETSARVAAAQKKAQEILSQARATLRSEADAAMAQLRGQVDSMAAQAVNRILG